MIADHPTIYLAHGFNVRDPRRLFALEPYFAAANYPVVRVDYGRTGLISARIAKRREGQRLAEVCRSGDIAIGHSHGCAVISEALERGAPLSHVLFLNPALSRCYTPRGPNLRKVTVYYATDDRIVTAGLLLSWVSPLRLIGKQTQWGDMGRVGYHGDAKYVESYSLHDILETEEKVGHGGATRWDRVPLMAENTLAQIEQVTLTTTTAFNAEGNFNLLAATKFELNG